MKKLKLGLFILLSILVVNCNIVQSQKEDDKSLLTKERDKSMTTDNWRG
jgi:hypothetical protein